jgi:type I restriction enzyme, S subunit
MKQRRNWQATWRSWGMSDAVGSEPNETSLGQLVRGYRGVSYRPEHLRGSPDESTATLLRATNIQKGSIDFNDVQFVPKTIVAATQFLESGDIAVCMSNGSKALVGKSAPFRDGESGCFTVGAFCSLFKPIRRHDCGLIIHLFHSQTYQKAVDVALSGSAINNLKNSDVEGVRFVLPSRSTWRDIAAILSSVDRAIDKTSTLIEKQQRIKAGLMHDLFNRGVLPDGRLRPIPVGAPDQYQESRLGPVPVGWELTGLASRQRAGTKWIRTGPFGSALKGEHWVIDGHPVITIGAFGEGEFLVSDLLFVGARDAARLAEFQLIEGDVVFSRVADVGRSVVVRQDNAGWIMSSNLMRIALDGNRVRPDYLQMLLANDTRTKAQIRSRVNSGGREVANSEVLSQLVFAWPPIDEQDRIVKLGLAAMQRIAALRSQLQKLQLQKLGLMQDLLTGKVTVKVPEIAIPA